MNCGRGIGQRRGGGCGRVGESGHSKQVIDLQPSLEENGGSQVLNCGRGCGRGRGGGRGRDGVHGHNQQVIDLQPSHEENGRF